MNPAFSSANEFGFASVIPLDRSDSAQGQVPTTLSSIESQASGAAWSHPAVALFALVLATAVVLERTTKPVARAGASGKLGPAKGSIEGSL